MRSLHSQFVRSSILLLCFLSLSFGMTSLAYAVSAADTSAAQIDGRNEVSVVLWNRTIVKFRSDYEGYSPKERAVFAIERMNQMPSDLPEYKVIAADVLESGQRLAWIKVNGRIMFALMEADVDTTAGDTYVQAKERSVRAVAEWMAARKEQFRPQMLLHSGGIALLATGIFAVALLAVSRLFHKAGTALNRFDSRKVKHFMIGNFNLAPYITSFFKGMVRIAEGVILLGIAYLWLTYLLSLFPYTQPWSRELSGLLLEMLYDIGRSMLVSVPGLLMIALIFFISRILVKAVSAFFLAVENSSVHIRWFEPETAKATRRIVVVLIWIFALVVAYPLIPGSETKAFQGVSVFLGLMVSLGSAGLVGQLIGGIVAVYTRSFQPGDYVKIGEHEGTVHELGLLAAKIVTVRKEEVTIPNALLMSSTIVNYSRQAREDGAMVTTGVTIGYDVPWRQVHSLLLMGAGRTPGIRKSPEPFVLQKALSDFYVEYTLMFRIDRAEERYNVLSVLHGHIQDAFNEYGVQIMSPNFVMQPDKEVVVPKASWYAPPAGGGPGNP
jgi:small-conductance mechanosensitive channel